MDEEKVKYGSIVFGPMGDATPVPPSPFPPTLVWVIYGSHHGYWDGRDRCTFSDLPGAVRFSRQIDAERVRNLLVGSPPGLRAVSRVV